MLMKASFKPAALVLAVVALLALAPAAMAKGGGGGGGGGSCATIDSFTMSSGYNADSQPSVTWAAQTTNLCIDELAGTTAIDFSNSATGTTGRAVYAGRGTMSFGSTFTATPGV